MVSTANATLKKVNSTMQQHQKAGKQIAVKTNLWMNKLFQVFKN